MQQPPEQLSDPLHLELQVVRGGHRFTESAMERNVLKFVLLRLSKLRCGGALFYCWDQMVAFTDWYPTWKKYKCNAQRLRNIVRHDDMKPVAIVEFLLGGGGEELFRVLEGVQAEVGVGEFSRTLIGIASM